VRRSATAGAILLLWLGALAGGALALRGDEEPPPGPPPAPRPIELRTELPDWLAPGAPLRVHGFAGREEPVELLVGGRVVAKTLTGPRGGFRLAAPAPAPGRHPVAVRAGERRTPVGVLLVRPVKLAAVGDVMFSESVARGISDHGPGYPWSAAGPLLRSADVATANLETAISRRGRPEPKEFTFRGAPEALAGMRRIGGIGVVSVANNHAVDYGREAFLDTLRHTRAAGIVPVGGGANEAQARKPVFLERGGLRIAFLAYSDVNPAGFPAGPTTPGVARAVYEHIIADVRRARKQADVVVCWFHWGEELRAEPTSRQQQFAAAALEGGAHVVLGAHPHVLGPVLVPRRGSLVAWSLGNFVFPSFREQTVRTGVLVVHLDAKGVRGHRLAPYRINGFRPEPVARR
jgi:poly-gamma-glutamate capsule biosynthesis protein CapA/YwtB (metallophosphatase superfamily)